MTDSDKKKVLVIDGSPQLSTSIKSALFRYALLVSGQVEPFAQDIRLSNHKDFSKAVGRDYLPPKGPKSKTRHKQNARTSKRNKRR